jgi:hypothetical protein
VRGEERPQSGPGRPSQTPPRVGKALRYGLPVTRRERAEVIARTGQELGCLVLRTHGPTAGAMAQSAGEVLRASQEPHGVEQNFACLKDPVIGTSLFLKKPERNELPRSTLRGIKPPLAYSHGPASLAGWMLV